MDNPILRPALNSVRMTYDLAQKPEYQDLMTAVSPYTGERVNRFTHIHQSASDLVKKVKMQRLLGQQTASCFQRCVGMDAMNAVFSTTYEIDQKYGTSYHQSFLTFLKMVESQDLTVDGAMTDPKGDRSKAPHQQEDPDLFLRVVERRPDGIVVRGTKMHQTGILNSHEVIVMPTISMGPEDKDYAVCFAVPMNTKGIYMIVGRQSCDTRKLEGSELDMGNAEFGGVESVTVFDDVFVPNDRIFLNGETEFAGMVVERFAGYHRQSYGGCKVGVGDVLIGAAALAADYNGCAKASHIKDKLIEMIHLNETLYCCPRRHGGEPPARPPAHREPVPGHGGGGLPHRVHARRRLPPGPAHHDRPPGRLGAQEGTSQGYRPYQGVDSHSPGAAGNHRPFSHLDKDGDGMNRRDAEAVRSRVRGHSGMPGHAGEPLPRARARLEVRHTG